MMLLDKEVERLSLCENSLKKVFIIISFVLNISANNFFFNDGEST